MKRDTECEKFMEMDMEMVMDGNGYGTSSWHYQSDELMIYYFPYINWNNPSLFYVLQ